jgi:uncharacterized protein (TIGR03435 family)
VIRNIGWRWIIGIPAICLTLVNAQSQRDASGFDVASIRQNQTDDVNMGAFAQPGGRFRARNVPVKFLIEAAYDVKDFQVAAGSFSWIGADRFDIEAQAPEGTPAGFEPLKPMLRSLLASRFKLAFHSETRELPIFELVPARGGLKTQAPKDVSCVPPDPKHPQPRERTPFCDNIRTRKGVIEAYGTTMLRLAGALSDAVGRPVVDKTGFTGLFDAHLEFAPDESTTDPPQPSIGSALQQELAIRLNASKGPVQVIVIDSVERPTEN